MAYYSSGYYDDDVGEYDRTPYGGSYEYDSAPTQALMPYSSYESNHHHHRHQLFEYNATPYYSAYYHPAPSSTIAYSASTFSQPRFLEYYSNPYGGDYNSAVTQFAISYNSTSSEFNIPEFEEYDPTPYGGGLDLAQTYGKPLPPSDEICYPRSTQNPNALPGAITYGSMTLPDGKEETVEQAEKLRNGGKQSLPNEEEQKSHGGRIDNPSSDDYYPSSGYEFDKQVPQPPSGYGLEAMDLCESLFGYWPCLDREKRRCGRQEFAGGGCNDDPWPGSADYLFGSSYPYGERRDVGGEGSYGDPDPIYGYERHHQEQPLYGYERHHQEQPLYRQVDYDEDSWANKFSIF